MQPTPIAAHVSTCLKRLRTRIVGFSPTEGMDICLVLSVLFYDWYRPCNVLNVIIQNLIVYVTQS
jgi:hypothetical protein